MVFLGMVMTVIKFFLGLKKTNKGKNEVFQTDSMHRSTCESEPNLKTPPQLMSIQQTNTESNHSQWLSLVLLPIELFYVISEALFFVKKRDENN